MCSTSSRPGSGSGETLHAEELLGALERTEVRLAGSGEPGRVAVLDLMRARTRRFEAVFVLGLEQGSLPRREPPSPFLDEEARRSLDERRRARLVRPDPVSRDRYLVYTACTRATRRLVLVREAATDEGSPREASPFWEDIRAVFDPEEVARATVRRPLSRLTWPIERAPTERERLRALAALHPVDADGAGALALANGWERRLGRARSAFTRPTALRNPLVLEELEGRAGFNVTELERMSDCSSAWLVERYLSPRTIDGRADAKLRGSLAHTTLNRFYGGLSKHLGGAERVDEENLDAAVAFAHECLDGALEGVRLELTDLQRHELAESLRRDLEAFVRDEARSPSPFVPRHLEYQFALPAAEGLTVTGKIDRIDVDPFGARGIVHGLQVGQGGALGAPDRGRGAAADPALHARRPRHRRHRARRGASTGRSPATAAPAAWSATARASRGTRSRTCSTRPSSGSRSRRRARPPSGWPAGSAPATCGTTRAAASAPRGATSGRVPGEAAVSVRAPNPEQAAAIAARGEVFVSAGAGTGKTTVLVERFAEAVCERGLDVDSLLVITYTERAAGELRARIRSRLVEAGRNDLARRARRRVDLDDPRLLPPPAEGAPVRGRRSTRASACSTRARAGYCAARPSRPRWTTFCAGGRPEGLRLLATYGVAGLRRMLTSVYETLRSAGRELDLELGERAGHRRAPRGAARRG